MSKIPQAAIQSIQELSELFSFNLFRLPIHVIHKAFAPAYTDDRGIYLSDWVVQNDPANVKVYLAHEIGHHVIHDEEVTGKHDHKVVNRAEDYKINQWLKECYNLDVRKVAIQGLFNNSYKNKTVGQVCDIVARNPKHHFGACGHKGVAHPLIMQLARKLQRRHQDYFHRDDRIFYSDLVDEQTFLDQVEWARVLVNPFPKDRFAPMNTDMVFQGLWNHLYLPKVMHRPQKDLRLSDSKAIVLTPNLHKHRIHTVNDPEKAAVAAAIIIDNLIQDEAYIKEKRADAVEDVKYWTDICNLTPKQRRKKTKGMSHAEVRRRLQEAQDDLERWKSRRPIDTLLRIESVRQVLKERTIAKVVTQGLQSHFNKRPVQNDVKLPFLVNSDTVRWLRVVANRGVVQLRKIVQIRDEMRKLFDAIRQAEQHHQEEVKRKLKQEADKKKQEEDVKKRAGLALEELEKQIESASSAQGKPQQQQSRSGKKQQGQRGEGKDRDEEQGQEQQKQGKSSKAKSQGSGKEQVHGSGASRHGKKNNNRQGTLAGRGREGDRDDAARHGNGRKAASSQQSESRNQRVEEAERTPSQSKGHKQSEQEKPQQSPEKLKIGNGGGGGGEGAGSQATHDPIEMELMFLIKNNTQVVENILTYMKEIKSKLRKNPNRLGTTGVPIRYNLGNDLPNVHHSELALLHGTKEQKLLFFLKYGNQSLSLNSPASTLRQPLIIAVDGSGSMSGTPYQVACGFALALGSLVLEDNRGFALMVFDGAVTQEIVVDAGHDIPLLSVLKTMLKPGFGGTDFDAPLHRAFDIRDQQQWNSMMYVMLSDGYGMIRHQDYLAMRKRQDDQLIAVLTNKYTAGMEGFDRVLAMEPKNMTMELVDLGNSLL